MNFLDGMYYALYFIAFNYLFLTTTMFYNQTFWNYHGMLERAMNIVTFFLIGLSVVTIILLFDSWKERILPAVLFGAAIAYTVMRGGTYNNDILVFFLLAICSKKKSFKLIGYMSLLSGFIWLFASLIFCKAGILRDVISFNGGHGYGILCAEDLMCHIFTMTTLLFIIRTGRPGLPSIIMSFILLVLSAVFIRSDIGFISYLVLIVVTLIYKFGAGNIPSIRKKFVVAPFGLFMIISYIVVSALTIYLTFILTPSFIEKLASGNDVFKLIALKINCGKYAFSNYRILPFGQKVREFGEIANLRQQVYDDSYFVLDVSYMRLLFHNGYVMLAAVITLFTALEIRLYRERQFYPMFVVMLFSLVCAVDHNMIDPAYCVFAYLMFAELDFDRPFISSYINN